MNLIQTEPQDKKSPTLAVAWLVTLLISTLPTILWRELTGQTPAWLIWAEIALLIVMIVVSSLWKEIKGLRTYFIVFLILYLAEAASGWIAATPQWKSWFTHPNFTTPMLGVQILRLGVALLMILSLWVLKRQRRNFFLVRGEINAPVEPVKWLGVKAGATWKRFGLILTIAISMGTLAFLLIFGRPNFDALVQVLPMVPIILILALMNSFSEEMNYRASQLAALQGVLTNSQALLLTAAYFGIGHYYGVPYGIIGVLMAGFLGWLLGKSMLETRGFFWAWLIHFLQDVMIFSFMAIGSIISGGR